MSRRALYSHATLVTIGDTRTVNHCWMDGSAESVPGVLPYCNEDEATQHAIADWSAFSKNTQLDAREGQEGQAWREEPTWFLHVTVAPRSSKRCTTAAWPSFPRIFQIQFECRPAPASATTPYLVHRLTDSPGW